jgi:acyl-coenzyme A thioesterase 9
VTKPEAVTSDVSNTFMFKFYVGGKSGVEGGDDQQAGRSKEERKEEGAGAQLASAGPRRRVLPKSREEAAHIWERCERPRLEAELREAEASGGGGGEEGGDA